MMCFPAAAALGVVLSGPGCKVPVEGEGCLLNSDCGNPLACSFRRCHQACREDRDCPLGVHCRPSEMPGANVCLLDDERGCAGGRSCPGALQCADDEVCRTACAASNACLADQVCSQGFCANPTELMADGGLRRDGGSNAPEPDAGSTWDGGKILDGGEIDQRFRSSLSEFENLWGTRIRFTCPPITRDDPLVWGTDEYTTDSEFCRSCLHAGTVGTAGGSIVIEVRPGRASYLGSLRNGIASFDYGAWGMSYACIH